MTLEERFKKNNGNNEEREPVGLSLEERFGSNNTKLSDEDLLAKYVSGIQTSSKMDKYRSVMSNADYAEKSQYVPKDQNWFQKRFTNGPLDVLSESINGNPTGLQSVSEKIETSFLTPNEKALFNYFYNTGDNASAFNLYQDLVNETYKRNTEYQKLSAQNRLDGTGRIAGESLASIPSNVYGGIVQVVSGLGGALVGALSNGAEGAAEGWSQAAVQNPYSAYANAVREASTEKIAQDSGNKVAPFFYQTGMSVGDSLFSALISGGVGELGALLALGGSASQQKTMEVLNNGGTAQEAAMSGITSGVIEGLTEKVSLGHLTKILKGNAVEGGFKELAKTLAKNMLEEAGEEATSELTNALTDAIILDWTNNVGTESDLKKFYDEQIANGYSESEATENTIWELTKNTLVSAAGGALGALMSGGVTTGIRTASDYRAGKTTNEYGRTQDIADLARREGREDIAQMIERNPSNLNVGYAQDALAEEAIETLRDKKASAEDKIKGLERIGELKEKLSPITGIADKNGKMLHPTAIKWEEGSPVFVTEEGTYKATDVTVTNSASKLINLTEDIPEQARQTFIENYNGENLGDYVKKFEQAYELAKVDWQDDLAKMVTDGLLTETQMKNIYKAAQKDVTSESYQLENLKKNIEERKRQYPDKKIRVKIDTSAVDLTKLNANQRHNVTLAEALAKALGFNLTLFDSTKEQGQRKNINGSYEESTNTISLDINATNSGTHNKGTTNAIITTLSHEITHWSKTNAPGIYKAFRDTTLKTLNENSGQNFSTIGEYVDVNKVTYPGLSYDGVADELVARACENMLQNSEYAKEALGRMTAEEQKTLGEKIIEFFNKIREAIKEIMGRSDSNSLEYRMLKKDADRLAELQKMWDNLIREAASNAAWATEQTDKQIENAGMQIIDDIVYSLKTLSESWIAVNEDSEAERDRVANLIASRLEISHEKARQYLDDIYSVAKVTADNKFMEFEDSGLSVWVKNSEYGGNFDFSFLCPKRLTYTGTLTAIREKINKPMTVEDFLDVRRSLIEHGYEAPCSFCFVEASRRDMDKQINKFINANPKYGFTIAQLTNADFLDKLRQDYENSGKTLDNGWEAFSKAMNKLGQRKPKALEKRRAYRGEILDLKNKEHFADVNKINRNRGLRFFAFSDFEIPHMLDMMQIAMDMSVVGLDGFAYTKQPTFAKIFGATGIKINLSTVAKGVDKNGRIIFDDVEGINSKEAIAIRNGDVFDHKNLTDHEKYLRDQYRKNCGIVCVVFTPEQLTAALADDRIDYVLPFHASGMKKDLWEAMGLPEGTQDFTKGQSEKEADEATHRTPLNIPVAEFWEDGLSGRENAQRYLDIINERGMTPLFPVVLDHVGGTEVNFKNGRHKAWKGGKWVLPEGKIGDGYYKLLIEQKMYDNEGNPSPQRPVMPEFNMAAAEAIGKTYHDNVNVFPVAHDVVNEFVGKKTQFSVKEDSEGRRLTEDQTKFFENSVVRDSKGRLIRVYHGTKDGGFTVFNKSDDGISYFFTDNKEVAESYSGVSVLQNPDTPMTFEELEGAFEFFDNEIQKIDNGYLVTDSEGKEHNVKSLKEAQAWLVDNNVSMASAQGIGEATNYEVYLNIQNPLVIDAQGENWSNVNFEPEDTEVTERMHPVYSRLLELWKKEREGSLTKAENIELDEVEERYRELENELNRKSKIYETTRDVAKYAYESGYDGVIFKNIVDNGGYSLSDASSTVYVVFNSNQIKSIYNEHPTENPDIRYSRKEDSEGKELSKDQVDFFARSQARDEDGRLKPFFHGTSSGGFTIFNKSDDGFSYFFTDSESVARTYAEEVDKEVNPYDPDGTKGYYKVYLNATNPLIVEGNGNAWDDIAPEGEYKVYTNVRIKNKGNGKAEVDYYDLSSKPSAIKKEILTEKQIDELFGRGFFEDAIESGEHYEAVYVKDGKWAPSTTRQYTRYAKRNGYDSVIFYDIEDSGGDEFIDNPSTVVAVFDSNQIKSIYNLHPTENLDIRYSEKEGMGNGYFGYSMSNNALMAYENGEKPISKWSKSEILEAIQNINPSIYEEASKLDTKSLRDMALVKTSWHHTSKMYNKTNFYSIDEDGIQRLTAADVPKYKSEKIPDKTYRGDITYLEWSGTQKHPKADKKTLEDVNILEKGSFYYIYDDDGKLILKKKIGSNGTDVVNYDEVRRREAAKAERDRKYRENSTPEAYAYAQKLLSSTHQTSWSGNIYPYGRKPSSYDYDRGLENFFKKGEQIIQDTGDKYILKTWNGKEWVEQPSEVFSYKDNDGYLHLETDDVLSMDDFEDYLNRVIGRNKRIEAHLRRLNVKIKDNVILNQTKLHEFAKIIKDRYGLTGTYKSIEEELSKAYMKVTDIEGFNKAAESVAEKLIEESRHQDIDPAMIREVEALKKELKGYKIALNDVQKQELANTYGSNWSSHLLGKVRLVSDGIKLDELWDTLVSEHPDYFSTITDADEGANLAALLDRLYSGDYNGVRWTKEMTKERTEWLINDIREASWRISDNLTMAEKYDEAMKELRERLKNAKEEVREDAQRKRLIQKIVEREDRLITMLRKNDKENHIPDVLKAPLKALLDLVDVQAYVTTEAMANNFNALANALQNVSADYADPEAMDNALKDLTLYFDSNGYFVQNVKDIAAEVQAKVGNALGTTKHNSSILDLSTDSLKKLNEALVAISHAAWNYDKVLAEDTTQRISTRSESTMTFLGQFDNRKAMSDVMKRAISFLAWDNTTPIYGYDRFGNGGKETFRGIMKGDDQLTLNSKVIIDFTKSVFTGQEAEDWSKEIHDLGIGDYKITTAQIMSLYCLNKRQAAKQHLYAARDLYGKRLEGAVKNVYGEVMDGKGIVIGETKGIEKSKAIQVTKADVERITSMLTDRQKEVADKLQEFMGTVCADWGNYVTMRRFGIMQFGEDNYFPMQVFLENRESHPKETVQQASIFKLLNMGFTKSLNERGNGALELNSIFDVFIRHSSEMAAYNAFALPILDAYKWLSYKEEGTDGIKSLKTASRLAYGNDGINFIMNHLEDLNGTSNTATSAEQIVKNVIRRYKTAATAANMRVVLMQPTSYLRAVNEIDSKYLRRAINLNPKALKATINEMNEKSPLAMKKNGLGAFDVNISRTVAEQALQTKDVKSAKGVFEKAMNVSMIFASKADEITWATLYKAVQLETKEKHPELQGDAFDSYVNDRFRDICYRTQVFDSINARSNLMRKKDIGHQMLTAFGSEPTLSYSMLSNNVFLYAVEARNGQYQRAWNKYGKKIKHAFVAFMLSAIAVSAVAAVPDWLRDDEDDKNFIETYFKNFGMNILGEATGLLPYFRDIYSVFIEGYDPSRPDEEIFKTAKQAKDAMVKAIEDGQITYRTVYQAAKLFSQSTGLPIGNLVRDFKSLWNKTVGEVFGMKIK